MTSKSDEQDRLYRVTAGDRFVRQGRWSSDVGACRWGQQMVRLGLPVRSRDVELLVQRWGELLVQRWGGAGWSTGDTLPPTEIEPPVR